MEIDVRLTLEIIGAIVLVFTALQTYRKGNTDAMTSLAEMAKEQADSNYKLLQECRSELQIHKNNASKWRDAFKLRGTLMQKSGVKVGKWTFSYVSDSSHQTIRTDYIDQSNAKIH